MSKRRNKKRKHQRGKKKGGAKIYQPTYNTKSNVIQISPDSCEQIYDWLTSGSIEEEEILTALENTMSIMALLVNRYSKVITKWNKSGVAYIKEVMEKMKQNTHFVIIPQNFEEDIKATMPQGLDLKNIADLMRFPYKYTTYVIHDETPQIKWFFSIYEKNPREMLAFVVGSHAGGETIALDDGRTETSTEGFILSAFILEDGMFINPIRSGVELHKAKHELLIFDKLNENETESIGKMFFTRTGLYCYAMNQEKNAEYTYTAPINQDGKDTNSDDDEKVEEKNRFRHIIKITDLIKLKKQEYHDKGLQLPKRVHIRRGHYRTFRADRYKKAKGQRRWVNSMWINKDKKREVTIDGRIHRVLLDK